MSNFDGREPCATIKAMFAKNEGDDAIIEEAFAFARAEAAEKALASAAGLDWLYIVDKALGGDGNGTHGQNRFGFNAHISAAILEGKQP